ncbi:hypothetical protein HDZ31DRAFT_60116 [Schizophyllum fasciatum]
MAPIRHMMDMPGGHMMSEAEMTDMMGSAGHSKCVVMFKEGTSAAEIKQHASDIEAQGGVVTEIYDYMLKGFSAVMPEAMITQLQSLTGSGGIIDYIERDA